MATLNGEVSVELVDSYGIPGTSFYNITIDDTKTIAQLMSDVQTLSTDTEALSQGLMTKYSCRIIKENATGVGNGDIEKGALFNFANATDTYATGFLVPDVNPTILNANGLVDLTNTSVTDWITFMTTAHTVITVVTKGVRALSGLIDALITFRKHRKPLSRRTKEV